MDDQQPKIIYVQAPPPKYSGWCIAGFIISFFPVLFLFSLCFCIAGIVDCHKLHYRGEGLGVAGLTITLLEIGWFILMLV